MQHFPPKKIAHLRKVALGLKVLIPLLGLTLIVVHGSNPRPLPKSQVIRLSLKPVQVASPVAVPPYLKKKLVSPSH